ncbi:MAG: hypothetical protein BAA04_02270 [Firmicutes bacterium ZCTH02-B6]|nr:MAG: hypothetical protein BAA04_02270 [Firmicutes bacterium ZCTH02-B6]
MTTSTLLLLIFSVAMGVVGQLLLKRGMMDNPLMELEVRAVVKAILQPAVLLGFVCYGLAAISWLVVLSRAPLSVAYPMLSLGYAAVAVLSWQLFGESMNAAKVVGIAAILGGIVLLSRA